MASGVDRPTLEPILITENQCKKCKQKVSNAVIRCIECGVTYHKSCFSQIKSRNFEIISESEMKCVNHPSSPLPEDLDTMKKMMMELKKENNALKAENRKLSDEIVNLQKGNMQAASGDLVKTVTDKILDNVEILFKNFEEKVNINIQQEIEKYNINTHAGSLEANVTSYSQAVSRKRHNNILIIKPKNQQPAEKTWQSIEENVHPETANIGITHTRHTKNGGIIIGCKDSDDLVKLEEQTRIQLDEANYEVIKPKKRLPKIKIVDIPGEFTEETLKSTISAQNPKLAQLVNNWRFITTKKMKKTYMAIFEVDQLSFREIVSLGNIFIKWVSCRVFEYFDIFRCYKCGDFNHTSANCKEDIQCLNCGESGHVKPNCGNKFNKCNNCHRANIKWNLKLDVSHSCFDHVTCKLLKKQIEYFRNRTVYEQEE